MDSSQADSVKSSNTGGAKKRNWKGQMLTTADSEQIPPAAIDEVSEDDSDLEDPSSEEEDEGVHGSMNPDSSGVPVTPGSYRQNRKKSRAWNCFERGEYNKTAHRFTATCKYCLKKFDGRLPKLKGHIMECPEISMDVKTQCLKDTDDEETDEERMEVPSGAIRPPAGVTIHTEGSIPHSAKSRRGRPASKLWDCFIRGEYSKSAHRFSAVCKYCQATIDGRKQKLKHHILICAMIDPEMKEAYRALNLEEIGSTPKKMRLTDSTPKGNRPKSSKKSYQEGDHLLYGGNSGSNDAMYYGNDLHDHVLRFFLRYGLPFSAVKDPHFQAFVHLLDPNLTMNWTKEEVIDLITRNYNIVKQQEVNLLKNESFLTLAFHSEQSDESKLYHYFTTVLSKLQNQAFNVHSFSLENKNEIHLVADRWKQAVQNCGKVVAITCDTDENYKLAMDWISNFDHFHHISVIRCFKHAIVEFASSIFGHPYAIPIISDSFFLLKNLRSFCFSANGNSASMGGGGNGKASKPDQLLETIYYSLIWPTRNNFLSLFLMIESIIKAESLIHEWKSTVRNPSGLSPVMNSSKYWASLKTIYGLMKPFLEILTFVETSTTSYYGNTSGNSSSNTNNNPNSTNNASTSTNSTRLSLADTGALWIYLTNQLEIQLPVLPEDYRQYIINIYNQKLTMTQFMNDLQKLSMFLHPKYTKGLVSYQETFFKPLLKYSCTFIQGYGYNEVECGKLISQMIAYRNTSNSTEFPDNVELHAFWQTMNQGKDFQTLQTLVTIIFDIIPFIQGQGRGNNDNDGDGGVNTMQLNGQYPAFHHYDNFTPELKSELNNAQFLSMVNTIRTHELFASGGVGGSKAGYHHVNDVSDFDTVAVERYELTNALEFVYRRDLATLFKSTDLSSQDGFMKMEGINYDHPVYTFHGKFNREGVSLNHLNLQSGDKHNTPNRKSEQTSNFDIDALIEMTYNA